MEKNIVVPVTSDKGLCGGINSTVVKYSRGTMNTVREGAFSLRSPAPWAARA